MQEYRNRNPLHGVLKFLPCASLTIPVMMTTMRASTLATVLTTWRMAPHFTFMQLTKVSRPGRSRESRLKQHVTDGELTATSWIRVIHVRGERAEFQPAGQQSVRLSWFNYHFLMVQSLQDLGYRLAIHPWHASVDINLRRWDSANLWTLSIYVLTVKTPDSALLLNCTNKTIGMKCP